jgi:hypothetical protein
VQHLSGQFASSLFDLDAIALTATKVAEIDTRIWGITFAPDLRGRRYCAAKKNSAGCFPSIHSLGFPSVEARKGFSIWADQVVNQGPGTLFFGITGPASMPFKGGMLCVSLPFRLSQAVASGGSPKPTLDCSGVWSLDFNKQSYAVSHLPAGTAVWCQWFGRDRGIPPPNDVVLSDALQFTIQP